MEENPKQATAVHAHMLYKMFSVLKSTQLK